MDRDAPDCAGSARAEIERLGAKRYPRPRLVIAAQRHTANHSLRESAVVASPTA